jgi:hypothetical protein
MPANIVKNAEDERLWSKAKKAAADQGRAKDYAYITGIFKRMQKGCSLEEADKLVKAEQTSFPGMAPPKRSATGRSGEGSRGGKVIGHTKSGNPIYQGDKRAEKRAKGHERIAAQHRGDEARYRRTGADSVADAYGEAAQRHTEAAYAHRGGSHSLTPYQHSASAKKATQKAHKAKHAYHEPLVAAHEKAERSHREALGRVMEARGAKRIPHYGGLAVERAHERAAEAHGHAKEAHRSGSSFAEGESARAHQASQDVEDAGAMYYQSQVDRPPKSADAQAHQRHHQAYGEHHGAMAAHAAAEGNQAALRRHKHAAQVHFDARNAHEAGSAEAAKASDIAHAATRKAGGVRRPRAIQDSVEESRTRRVRTKEGRKARHHARDAEMRGVPQRAQAAGVIEKARKGDDDKVRTMPIPGLPQSWMRKSEDGAKDKTKKKDDDDPEKQEGTREHHRAKALAHLQAAQAHAAAAASAEQVEASKEHRQTVSAARQASEAALKKSVPAHVHDGEDEILKSLDTYGIGVQPAAMPDEYGRYRLARMRGERLEKSVPPEEASRMQVLAETVELDPAGNDGNGGLPEWFAQNADNPNTTAPVGWGGRNMIKSHEDDPIVPVEDTPFRRAAARGDGLSAGFAFFGHQRPVRRE